MQDFALPPTTNASELSESLVGELADCQVSTCAMLRSIRSTETVLHDCPISSNPNISSLVWEYID